VPTLYVICPSESYFPGIEAWIVDAWSMLPAAHQATGWVYDLWRADKNNTFVPLSVYSRIAKNVGPVLILGSIKREPIAVLSTKLMTKCVINHVRDLQHVDGLRESIVRTLDRHANGEPYVPLRLAATLQILWKLQKGDYWGGGSKNKAFIWASDLPKGRGVTDVIAPHSLMVANELRLKGLLQSKTSQGDLKYALNKDHLPTMNAIFQGDWEKIPEGLAAWLLNNEEHVLRTEIAPAIAGWVFAAHGSNPASE
jgi:hypothetical protein